MRNGRGTADGTEDAATVKGLPDDACVVSEATDDLQGGRGYVLGSDHQITVALWDEG